jgi:hypothetical protein
LTRQQLSELARIRDAHVRTNASDKMSKEVHKFILKITITLEGKTEGRN